MRVLFAAILVALPALAAAQSPRSAAGTDPPLPPIGLPLPQIGFPLSSLAPPRVDAPTSRGDRRSPPVRRERRRGGKKGGRSTQSIVYIGPAYIRDHQQRVPADRPAPVDVSESSRPQEPGRPTGSLWLDLEEPSGTAQLYVGGFYIGTTNDVGGELTLEAGAHTIEIRAPGYETIFLNVKIEPGRAITYRGTLQPVGATGTAEPPTRVAEGTPAERKPFYVIPGCYVGDVPPKDAGLPATCDQSRAVTIWP